VKVLKAVLSVVPGHAVVVPGGGSLLRGWESFSASGEVRCVRGLNAVRVERKVLGLWMVLEMSE